MEKCVNTWLKLDKCTEISHSCYLTCNYCSRSILLCCVKPWVCIIKLKAESDLLAVNVLDECLNSITNLEISSRASRLHQTSTYSIIPSSTPTRRT